MATPLNRPKEYGDFLWINKDQASIRNKDRIGSAVRSHVQQRPARRRNLQIHVLSGHDFETRAPKDQKVHIGPGKDVPPALKNAISRTPSKEIVPFHGQCPSPTTYLGGGADDPFSSTIAALDDGARLFASNVWYAIASNVYLLARRTGRIHKQMEHPQYRVLHRLLIDPTELYSQLAIIPPYMRSAHGSPGHDGPLSQTAGLLYHQKTIKLVRQNMSAALLDISEGTIFAVLRLAYLESIRGNHNGYLVHLNGAFDLVKARGGLQTLNVPGGVEQLVMTDVKCATMSGTSKLCFPIPWREAALPPEEKHYFSPPANSELSLLGSRLLQGPLKLHADLTRIIRDLREVVWLIELSPRALKCGHTIDWFRHERWIRRQTLSVEHRLLSLPPSAIDSDIVRAIRLTILIYTNLTLITLIPTSALQVLLPRLRRWISRSPLDTYWEPYTDALFWALCIGLHLSQGSEHELWFLGRVADAADFLGLRGWDEAQELLIGFFYLEWYHGPVLEKMWEKVVMLLVRRVIDAQTSPAESTNG